MDVNIRTVEVIIVSDDVTATTTSTNHYCNNIVYACNCISTYAPTIYLRAHILWPLVMFPSIVLVLYICNNFIGGSGSSKGSNSWTIAGIIGGIVAIVVVVIIVIIIICIIGYHRRKGNVRQMIRYLLFMFSLCIYADATDYKKERFQRYQWATYTYIHFHTYIVYVHMYMHI